MKLKSSRCGPNTCQTNSDWPIGHVWLDKLVGLELSLDPLRTLTGIRNGKFKRIVGKIFGKNINKQLGPIQRYQKSLVYPSLGSLWTNSEKVITSRSHDIYLLSIKIHRPLYIANLNSHRAAESILGRCSFPTDGEHSNDEAETCKSGGAPESSWILLGESVSFLDINRWCCCGGDGESNSRSYLKCCVKHSTAQAFHFDGNAGQNSCARRNEDKGHSGYTNEWCAESVDPARVSK